MADMQESAGQTPNKPQWDQDLIFFVLSVPVRRKLLLDLARGGPKPANELNGGVSRTSDGVLKHLSALREAGLVSMNPNPKDGRRSLYALSPLVPLITTATGPQIDFGFCILRLEDFDRKIAPRAIPPGPSAPLFSQSPAKPTE
ncbi:MAG: helix-turn-helix transcriptional regulator [Verrucomicrobia bacterium]|nr:helix-turn-helix transcriptional regulator [Verrucomicrobiota bacterium]